MGTKYLSDVLTSSNIIQAPNNKICIFSGVGSGKNWFVEHELIKEGNILYVTSRRAKVNEILEEKIAQERITWDRFYDDVVTTTNYGIERLVMNEKFGGRLSEIIQHFAFIVVDEAHSIATDAAFSDSAFHLNTFLEYVSEKYPNIKIILMTGTPEPLMSLHNFKNSYYIFDMMDECINIVPKRIRFINQKDAINIMSSLPKTEKTIYYSNSAQKIVHGKNSLYNQLLENDIAEQEISICMGEKNIDKNAKYLNELKEICDTTKKAITQTRTLPEKSRILLTTSTLKEGINIEDPAIKVAFCETHLLSDIQQFAGRVRTTLNTLYIIQDALQHDVNETLLRTYTLEALYSAKYVCPTVNSFIEKQIKSTSSVLYRYFGYDFDNIELDFIMDGDFSLYTYGGDAIKDFVNLIENKHQYVKFNHLLGEFQYFKNRFFEQKRVHKAIYCKNWIKDLAQYTKKYSIDYIPPVFEYEADVNLITDFLSNRVGKKLIDNEKAELEAFLIKELNISSSHPKINTLNLLLHKYEIPFSVKNGTTSRNSKNKRYLMVENLD